MEVSRREFIKYMIALGFSAATAGALFSQLSCSPVDSPAPTPAPIPIHTPPPPPAPSTGSSHLVVARGESPTKMVHAAIKALGGIEHFVKPGNDVIIKPNICTANRTYEYAATTNPEVVGALTALCLGAGAKRVRVMDQPFSGTPQQAHARSGIEEAVHAAGGQMEVISSIKFQDTSIPEGQSITSWPVYSDVLSTDVLINVPIAKHHSLGRLTLGMKNLMGIILNPNKFHSKLGQRLADLTSLIRPPLTIVDGVRILMNHGPTGGDLNDVKMANTIIASQDIVAADSYAATLFGLTGNDIPAIRAGAQMGLGTMDLNSVKIEEISI